MQRSRIRKATSNVKVDLLIRIIIICVVISCSIFYFIQAFSSISLVPKRNKLQSKFPQTPSLFESIVSHLSRKGEDGNIRKIQFFSEAIKIPDIEDITLVTHASVSRLNRVLLQAKIWKGPISLGVYITSKKDINELVKFLDSDPIIKHRMDIHLVVESPVLLSGMYPINYLRNIALESSRSDFVLPVDADFITNADAYKILRSSLVQHKLGEILKFRSLLVIPAFERFSLSNKSQEIKDLAITKKQLKELVEKKEAAPFHMYFKEGHSATDYDRWYNINSHYPIEYQFRFEPYVLAYKYGLPQYWEKFRGFGYNKASWLLLLHYEKYKFYVMENCFLIHVNHADGGEGRMPKSETIEEWRKFKLFLHRSFGAKKEDLMDWTSFQQNALI